MEQVESDRIGVLRRRLTRQRLDGSELGSAAEVVRLLTCVQSQECAHAFWSLGMRTTGLTYRDVQAEFDRGDFLRTHILRPTWHFIAPEDLLWVQSVTAPRVHRLNRGTYQRLGLDLADFDRSREIFLEVLGDGRHRTRAELAAALASCGIPATGLRLGCLVMNAELDGLICSGAMRGAQHTYALVSDRVPAGSSRTPDNPLGELALRFFAGHGPATVHDLSRWASLTVTACRAGLDAVRDQLVRTEVDGLEMWETDGPSSVDVPSPSTARLPPQHEAHSSPQPGANSSPQRGALLLPLYDEVALTYPRLNFPLVADHPHPATLDRFVGSVVVDETNVGTWRRTIHGSELQVEVRCAPATTAAQWEAVEAEAHRLARFLGLDLPPISRAGAH